MLVTDGPDGNRAVIDGGSLSISFEEAYPIMEITPSILMIPQMLHYSTIHVHFVVMTIMNTQTDTVKAFNVIKCSLFHLEHLFLVFLLVRNSFMFQLWCKNIHVC